MDKYIFGIDIGGTSVKIGFFSREAELIHKWEIPTKKEDQGAHILHDIAFSLKEFLDNKELSLSAIAGIGLDVPGPVLEDGTVSCCANLGWENFLIADAMKKEISNVFARAEDIRIRVINDANAAALGELWAGSGKGYSSLVMITLGTGVGGGVVIDKKAVHGALGAAGEIGHIKVNDNETEKCNCGKKGCLQQYASATGIVRLAKMYLAGAGTVDSPSKESSLMLNQDNMSAKMVLEAAKAGDETALVVYEKVSKYLGEAIAIAVTLIDPEIITIGGGVSSAGEFLIRGIQKYYVEAVLMPLRNKPILLAKLGNDAGIYGAAKLSL